MSAWKKPIATTDRPRMSNGSRLFVVRSMRFLVGLALMVLTWAAVAVADQAAPLAGSVEARFESAMTAYTDGHFDQAREIWEPLAQAGHAPSQHRVGMLHDRGEGVDRDFVVAAEWYRKAATADFIPAQFDLAEMYALGEGVEQSASEAFSWFTRAATLGDARAQMRLGLMLAKGDGVPVDVDKADEWLSKAAAQGEILAQLSLGNLWRDRNRDKALPWYRAAATQGSKAALVALWSLDDAEAKAKVGWGDVFCVKMMGFLFGRLDPKCD